MNSHDIPVLILMSTYQGAAYLAAQLDSLRQQQHQHWQLIIRDDGSTDETHAILKTYSHMDSRITVHVDTRGNLGPAQSFAALMQAACTRCEPIIFFSDQDDVWLPHKITAQLTTMRDMQDQFGEQVPLLVHSDLCVVDENLQLIAPSYLAYEGIRRNTSSPLHTLLINNFVTGCTIAMNRPLLEIATPMPEAVFMHDWWCALCAASLGKIGFTDERVILYRQHRANTIGSSGRYAKFTELRQLQHALQKRRKNLSICFEQAEHLAKRIKDDPHSIIVERFQALPYQPLWQRYWQALSLSLQPTGWLRAMMFWLLLASLGKKAHIPN